MTRFEPVVAAPAQELQDVVVRTTRLVPRGGAVLFAAVPGNSPNFTGRGPSRAESQRRLVTLLWEHLRANDDSPGKTPCFSKSAVLSMQIVHDAFGRPLLRSRECRGPAISFSEGGGSVWAALCGEEAEVGIDVAGSGEFPGTYPFHRVFHGEELAHALRFAGGDQGGAAALLWSIKEAVVKALGCGFHGVDPREITVHPGVGDDDGHTFPVGLSGKALQRLPREADRALWVRAFPQEKMWLSIALLSRQA